MEKAQVKYRGLKLEFNEHDETWIVITPDGDYDRALTHKSFRAIKLMIDKQMKKTFVPFDAYYKTRWSDSTFRPCRVTSMVRGTFDLWIVYEGHNGKKNRTKVGQSEIMQKTPEADQAFEQIEILEEVIKSTGQDIQKLAKTFKPYWSKPEYSK